MRNTSTITWVHKWIVARDRNSAAFHQPWVSQLARCSQLITLRAGVEDHVAAIVAACPKLQELDLRYGDHEAKDVTNKEMINTFAIGNARFPSRCYYPSQRNAMIIPLFYGYIYIDHDWRTLHLAPTLHAPSIVTAFSLVKSASLTHLTCRMHDDETSKFRTG